MGEDYGATSDAELLQRTATDPEAFGAFYRRHVDALLAYCRRRTPSSEVAADIVAEAFAAALIGRERFDLQRGSALQWLLGIASHKISDFHRRGDAERRLQRRLKMREIIWTEEDLSHIERLGSKTTAGRLMEELPLAEQRAVTARILDGREYEDIARGAQESEAVIRKRVSRGLARMRNWIGET
jgi:RNA polymerase sigma factor (sigma-70 family)